MKNIYEIEAQEGFYLADEMEKMRASKDKGKVVVICKGGGSAELKNLRKVYLLDAGIMQLLKSAQKYHLCLENNNLTVTLTYAGYYICYVVRAKTDWKVIEVELVDKDMQEEPQPNHPDVVSRVGTETLHMMLGVSFRYGFSHVFEVGDDDFLCRYFDELRDKHFDKNEIGLAARISDYVSQHGMRDEYKNRLL